MPGRPVGGRHQRRRTTLRVRLPPHTTQNRRYTKPVSRSPMATVSPANAFTNPHRHGAQVELKSSISIHMPVSLPPTVHWHNWTFNTFLRPFKALSREIKLSLTLRLRVACKSGLESPRLGGW